MSSLRRTDIGRDGETTRQFLEEIEVEADRLQELIDSLLSNGADHRRGVLNHELQPTKPAQRQAGAGAESLERGIRNMIQKSILVVDDDALMRKLVSNNLKACGYQVQAACDGMAALELLNHQPFDLVLLDISMPELDGLQTLEIARRRFRMPIVIVSGRGSEADVLEALTRGADDYVVKPFGVDELVTRVASCLGVGACSPSDRST